MTDPIIPPLELVRKWQREANHNEPMFPQVAAMAAQWGADQELEACCELLKQKGVPAWSLLRTARRPKPPSLKEQALSLINESANFHSDYLDDNDLSTIRRALEALPDD